MIGKEKCKMLKEIRKEIAKENDIQMVIEECTHQGRCKGTCPKCEAEVAYLEEQLEKRRSLGKAVCVAGISAAMFTSTLQASSMQVYGKTLSQTNYSQGITGETPTPIPLPEGTMEPTLTATPMPLPEGTMAPASEAPWDKMEGVMPTTPQPWETATEIPLPEGTMAPVSEEPTVTATPDVLETITPSAIVSGTAAPITPIITETVTPETLTPETQKPTETPVITATPIPLPEGTMEPKNTATPPVSSYQPTETPKITAVPTPTDEYIVYTQSPVPQNTEQPMTTANTTNAPMDTEKKTTCVVTYLDEDGKTIFEIQEIEQGATLQNMPNPVREGYLFAGWYVQGQEQAKVSVNTKVSGDMNVVAHWKKVTVKETTIRRVKSLADGTLYIKWGKVQKAEGYKIVLASNNGLSKGRKYITVGSKKTSVKVKGLREGKKYYVAVYAYKKDSEKNKIYGTCKKNRSVTITVK